MLFHVKVTNSQLSELIGRASKINHLVHLSHTRNEETEAPGVRRLMPGAKHVIPRVPLDSEGLC